MAGFGDSRIFGDIFVDGYSGDRGVVYFGYRGDPNRIHSVTVHSDVNMRISYDNDGQGNVYGHHLVDQDTRQVWE